MFEWCIGINSRYNSNVKNTNNNKNEKIKVE